MLQIGGHKEFFSQKYLPIMVIFSSFTWKSFKNSLFWSDKKRFDEK